MRCNLRCRRGRVSRSPDRHRASPAGAQRERPVRRAGSSPWTHASRPCLAAGGAAPVVRSDPTTASSDRSTSGRTFPRIMTHPASVPVRPPRPARASSVTPADRIGDMARVACRKRPFSVLRTGRRGSCATARRATCRRSALPTAAWVDRADSAARMRPSGRPSVPVPGACADRGADPARRSDARRPARAGAYGVDTVSRAQSFPVVSTDYRPRRRRPPIGTRPVRQTCLPGYGRSGPPRTTVTAISAPGADVAPGAARWR